MQKTKLVLVLHISLVYLKSGWKSFKSFKTLKLLLNRVLPQMVLVQLNIRGLLLNTYFVYCNKALALFH